MGAPTMKTFLSRAGKAPCGHEEGVRSTLLWQGTYPSRADNQQRAPMMAMLHLKCALHTHSCACFYESIRKQITSLELGRQRVWLRGGEVKTGNWDYAKNTSQPVFTVIAFFSREGRRHQMPARLKNNLHLFSQKHCQQL